MRFAYADPPYYGCGKNLYGRPEWDTIQRHEDLKDQLWHDFPDGWALSLNSTTLHAILPLYPESVRVAAWVKPFASFKPGVNPAYAWEPVIFHGGRKRTRQQDTVRDWISTPITLQKGLPGAKPEAFCRWILDILGYEEGDEVVDLFPGTGVMGRVTSQRKLAF